MGTQPPDELLPRYARGDMTPEQAVGHILQNMVEMQKSLEELRTEIERLKAFVGMEGQ